MICWSCEPVGASSPRAGGGSDGNFTAALGIPTLDGLGIDGDGAHTLQDFMYCASTEEEVGTVAGMVRWRCASI